MSSPSGAARHGHAHFWERAAQRGITRKTFLTRSAGVVGAAAGLGLLAPAKATAANASPKPIPGGLGPADLGLPVPPFPEIIHVEAPGVLTPPDSEPITITDFKGGIGYAIIDGSGTGRNTATGVATPYSFNCDMRFMQGAYVAEDGHLRRATFGFI
jgi:hypothetical protein